MKKTSSTNIINFPKVDGVNILNAVLDEIIFSPGLGAHNDYTENIAIINDDNNFYEHLKEVNKKNSTKLLNKFKKEFISTTKLYKIRNIKNIRKKKSFVLRSLLAIEISKKANVISLILETLELIGSNGLSIFLLTEELAFSKKFNLSNQIKKKGI